RAVPVDRAEVALTVDQRVAQREVLDHPDERIVDGRVGVWMEALEHLTDDTGRLAVARVGTYAHLVHAVQDAPLNGLESITHVREGALDDDAHRVIEVRAPH